MDCNCIRNNFDVSIQVVDFDTAIFTDTSDWMEEDGYTIPPSYNIQIQVPNSMVNQEITLVPGISVTVKGKDLSGLRDGVYLLSTTSCGKTYSRYKAIFPYMRCCLDQAWVERYSQDKSQLLTIEQSLYLATVKAELKDSKGSADFLDLAKRQLDNLKCDCKCNNYGVHFN